MIDKRKYIVREEDEEENDEELKKDEEKELEEVKIKKSGEQIRSPGEIKREEYLKEKKKREKQLSEEKERNKIKIEKERAELEHKILNVLKKGKVISKTALTQLLIKKGVMNWHWRFDLVKNSIVPEIEELGWVLKNMRFKHKINFSIEEGSHVFYTNNLKPQKAVIKESEFNWKNFKIPNGENDLYIVFRIPGINVKSEHFLSSCFPHASFDGFTINIDKKFQKTKSFTIFKDQCEGRVIDNRLLIHCKVSPDKIENSVYKLVQIGRKIIKEMVTMNLQYSDMMVANQHMEFIPSALCIRTDHFNQFYKTKYRSIFKYFFDFPQESNGNAYFGRNMALYKEKEESFDIDTFLKRTDSIFSYQTKAFITESILNNWIINPNKAANYTTIDDELEILIGEYKQDIDTNRLIQERIEDELEKTEFFKEITSNLLLTLLGLSLLADNAVLRWVMLGFFVVINAGFFILRRNKMGRLK